MSDNSTQTPEMVTANVKLGGPDWQLQTKVSVPKGPMRLKELLPLVQSFANSVVDAAAKTAEEQGKQISCKQGCGACCRQLVPIAPTEAQHLRELVNTLPEPRRTQIRTRFAEAHRRLEEAGLLNTLRHVEQWEDDEGRSLGLEYFQLGIPCPFLEDESCSIHPDRPIACREYLVTSPAEHCAQPTAETVECVKLPLKVWPALALFDKVSPAERFIRWVPLILALEWAEAHPNEAPPRPGPELLQELFGHLTKTEQPGREEKEKKPQDGREQ